MDKERLEGQEHLSKGSSSQSRHVVMVEEKPLSQVSCRTSNKDFKEQLDCVRKETMALRGGALSKTVDRGAKDFSDVEGDVSCSEKSFVHQSVSSTNNVKSRHQMGNGLGPFHTPPSAKTIENRSLKSLGKCEDDARSIASTNSSNCSSMQSGTIRSSLKSIKYNSASIRSGEISSCHSVMSM